VALCIGQEINYQLDKSLWSVAEPTACHSYPLDPLVPPSCLSLHRKSMRLQAGHISLRLDCPGCSLQTSRTGCEPKLHLGFRFKGWKMANLAKPAPEPEVQREGWETILVPFAKFSWNNTTSPSEPQVCQVCTWTSAEPQGPGSARGWTKPTGPGSGLDKKCPNLYWTEPQTV